MGKVLLFILLAQSFNSGYSQEKVQILFASNTNNVIAKNIYGQFAEHLGRSIYDGFYRKGKIRTDVMIALKKIHVPNLRWPGGCFADQYHWRDGIGSTAARPKRVNTTWGMVAEDNSFGTAEFLELCRQIGCEPYIAGNVGTGTPQEMKDWIEYLNFNDKSALADLRKANGHPEPYRVNLWGVGNESWGCGGNMTPEYYAQLYRHFAAFCPDYPGAPLKKVVSGANADDYHWTEVMMKMIPAGEMYGLSLHYYTFPTGKWNPRGSATKFTEIEYSHTLKEALRMEEIITKHAAIMDKYDPQKKVALLVDEWGVWTDVEPGTPKYAMYQQNSMRDALVAAATLNIFNNHADRVRGANLAQTVNVIHSLILTKGDQMLLTPTYWVFDLYKVHQDARLIKLNFKSPSYAFGKDTVDALSASASVDKNNTIHISLVNLDPHKAVPFVFDLTGWKVNNMSGQVLTSAKFTDINTFENPNKVRLKCFSGFNFDGSKATISLPPISVVMLEIKR
ncbi:alpha-N-arabinofuranosidase [Mucilaginibacter sp. Mucisp84]|uniref:alpha-N-arabinofuranosidase n=1 Tax=Mucilaginibacter sp. Mucisp84 TaxID=3243058 RepID=UPI0039A6ED6A